MLITNELLGDVNNGLVTLVIVKVKLVPAFTTCNKLTLIKLAEMTVQVDNMALFNTHVDGDDDTLSWVYDGNVMLIYDPEINLFIVTNHRS